MTRATLVFLRDLLNMQTLNVADANLLEVATLAAYAKIELDAAIEAADLVDGHGKHMITEASGDGRSSAT